MDPFTSVWTATGTLQPPSWKQDKGMNSIKTPQLYAQEFGQLDMNHIQWQFSSCVCKGTHQLLEESSLWDTPQHCVWMVKDRHHFQNVSILCSDFHCQCSLITSHILCYLLTDISYIKQFCKLQNVYNGFTGVWSQMKHYVLCSRNIDKKTALFWLQALTNCYTGVSFNVSKVQ